MLRESEQVRKLHCKKNDRKTTKFKCQNLKKATTIIQKMHICV